MVTRSRIVFKGPDVRAPVPREDTLIAPDPLSALRSQSDEPLYVLKTVFPFVLFTDKVIIRPNHVDVITGIFFGSATSTRLLVRDIRQVEVQFNPIFATLEIIPLGPLEQMMRVAFLWKEEAKKARRIVAGLMETHRNNVDLSRYSPKELVTAVEEVGKASEV